MINILYFYHNDYNLANFEHSPENDVNEHHLVLAFEIHHTSNKTRAKSLHSVAKNYAERTKNNRAIKIFLLTSTTRCCVFFR